MRLVMLGAGLALAASAVAQGNSPTGPPPGRLVDVGGRSVHVRCVGPARGGPTIILEAGGGAYSAVWSAVQQKLAPRLRSCAHDRAGFGWSAGSQQSMAQDNADLRALLIAADIPGPYVLVGHSVGALLVRRYLLHYPENVIGMILAGPTHESTRLFFPADGQWKRMREQPFPTGVEFQEIYAARQLNPTPLGTRPLVVVVGVRPEPAVSTPDDVAREKAAELEEQPRISTNAKLVRDPSSGHDIHVDNPALVARVIEEVVTAAVTGGRLPPER
jgi:pimeloyl-ACP methyl ester carboxylesterase